MPPIVRPESTIRVMSLVVQRFSGCRRKRIPGFAELQKRQVGLKEGSPHRIDRRSYRLAIIRRNRRCKRIDAGCLSGGIGSGGGFQRASRRPVALPDLRKVRGCFRMRGTLVDRGATVMKRQFLPVARPTSCAWGRCAE